MVLTMSNIKSTTASQDVNMLWLVVYPNVIQSQHLNCSATAKHDVMHSCATCIYAIPLCVVAYSP